LKVKKTRVLKNDKYLQADVSSHWWIAYEN
jgi:hypothetical protein